MKKLIVIFTIICVIMFQQNIVLADNDEDNSFDVKNPPEEILELREKQKKDQISFYEISQMSDEELRKMELLPLSASELLSQGIPYVSSRNKVRAQDNDFYYVTTPTFIQCENYYCGPAATLMALYAGGCYGSVSGSTSDQKQRTLASSTFLNIDYYEGTFPESIAYVMNYFTNRFRAWTSAKITSSNQYSTFEYYTRSNLSYDNAIICCVDMQRLSYVNYGMYGTHYITVTAINYLKAASHQDYENIVVTVQDPNYNWNYSGTHWVDFENLMFAMQDFPTSNNFVY